jgi:hypothetical protein
VDATASGVPHPQTVWGFLLRLSCQSHSCCLGPGHTKTCASHPADGIMRLSVVRGAHATPLYSPFHSSSPYLLPGSSRGPGRR